MTREQRFFSLSRISFSELLTTIIISYHFFLFFTFRVHIRIIMNHSAVGISFLWNYFDFDPEMIVPHIPFKTMARIFLVHLDKVLEEGFPHHFLKGSVFIRSSEKINYTDHCCDENRDSQKEKTCNSLVFVFISYPVVKQKDKTDHQNSREPQGNNNVSGNPLHILFSVVGIDQCCDFSTALYNLIEIWSLD